ncbi:hybrid sensor histidine kinase/response regulator transcription factor [Plebeiibacterium sediminum]|nr:hybrid sensor histidine kinase/response regulator transcription factor [Plebeiobacterium sediminum]
MCELNISEEVKRALVKYILVVLINFLFISFLFSQEKESLYFSNLRQEDGLPSNMINSVVQDKLGFIWISTNNGICRYDGYSTLLFQQDATHNSITNNNVSSMLMEGDTLWVGTWRGLCYINTITFEVNRVNLGPEITIRSLCKSMDGRLWIGTSKGLIIYDRSKNQYKYFDPQNSDLSHSTIRCFYETKDSTMWIGTYHKLNKYKNGKFESFDLKGDYKPLLKNNLILDIKPLSDDNDTVLLIGTETGLSVFNTKTGKSTLYNSSNTKISNEVVKCIHREDDQLWLGTDFGLSVFNLNFEQIDAYYHNPIINHSIANNVVWDIFRDRNNVIWLLTSNGISSINKKNPFFKLHEEFYSINNQKAGNQIRDMLVASDGKTYMATIHGVIVQDQNSSKRSYFTVNSEYKLLLDNTYALAEDPYGKIWIATAGGINIWDPIKREMHAISANRNNGLTSNYISSFALTNKGTLWVNAWEGGVFRVTGDLKNMSAIHFDKIEDAAPDRIFACIEDIYFTESDRLYKIDHSTLVKENVGSVSDHFQKQNISSLTSLDKQSLWIASNKQLAQYFPSKDSIILYPLNNPVVQTPISLEIDQDTNIWMASLTTVSRFNTHSGKIISMPLNPGFPLKNFYSQCSTSSKNGVVLFGGDNGYVEVNSAINVKHAILPNAVISGLQINNDKLDIPQTRDVLKKDIAYTKHLELDYSNNSVTFYFSTLNYWLPQKSHFRYKLNNFDTEWRSTQDVNYAAYSNLKPGLYELEVEAINYAGLQSESSTKLDIVILPPLWLSRPFIALYILIFIGLIYFTFRIYVKRQQIYNQLRLANLEKVHSEEILNTKQQFFTNISHEFRTPLSLITSPIQQVLNSGELHGKNLEMLKLAEKNSKRLLKLVNQILDFRKMEEQDVPLMKSNVDIVAFSREIYDSFIDLASRNEISYEFISGEPSCKLVCDKEKTEAILFNLLANAFKHTPPNGKIQVVLDKITQDRIDKVQIKVIDTGAGINIADQAKIFNSFYQASNNESGQQGTGIGLAMAKQYALLHQGDIKVKSELNAGSEFTFVFPIELPDAETVVLSETNKEEPAEENKRESVDKTHLKKLLIVDDNPDILDYIEINLGAEYNIFKATNGSKGLEMAEEVKPDIIVSDIMMPVMDGLEMCKVLKQNPNLHQVPVILLTAKSLDVQKVEGIESGANMYITKPFDINYLKACIVNLLERDKQLYDFIKKQLLIKPMELDASELNQDEIFIKKVMDIISENISNPNLSVDLISSQLGLSSTHLYRKLKAITNQSAKDILKNYRLQKAAQMIQNNEGNITEIMYNVGFNSLSSFSKSFKTKFGVSPSEYAKK